MALNIFEKEPNLLPPADWAEEIAGLQEELIIERDRNLRTLADFKNYRRRVENEGNILAEKNKKEIMLSLLNIVDDMEKALQAASNAEIPLVKGVQLIYQNLLTLLESYGVFPIESIGAKFDTNLHEAVAMAECEGVEPGTVVNELRRGYFFNNELLRVTQVRVAGL